MSKTMSLRLTPAQLAAVEKWRRRFHQRSTSAALQLLLEEKLRQEAYDSISFADSSAGRQAYLTGTGLAVWEVMMVARAYEGDTRRTADHLEIPERLVRAAVKYAADFREEIEVELAENDAMDAQTLECVLPDLRTAVIPRALDPSAGTGAAT